MKNYNTIFVRPNTTVAFPPAISPDLSVHIQATYSQCEPAKLIRMSSAISPDLSVLTVTRTFVNEADAVAYSQDPVVVAFEQDQAAALTAAGIARRSEIMDPVVEE